MAREEFFLNRTLFNVNIASPFSLRFIIPYLLTWAMATISLLTIAYLVGIAPFGEKSVLTIDLSQQYIDFFRYYRDTILHHHDQFFYSFSKGFGGEMIGLWAYYLMSPFNLILLLFKEARIIYGVSILLYVKIIALALSFQAFQRYKYPIQSNLMSTAFALCYAFMSYVIIYALNIMWLDAVILLPILALSLEQLLLNRQRIGYTVALVMLYVTHFYMGFLVSIFLAFYAVFIYSEQSTQFRLKAFCHFYGMFIVQSLIAVLISGVVLLPTVASLMQNKLELQHNMQHIFEIGYSLQDVGSKLFIGNFVSDEMANGSPNIYIGLFPFILVMGYFLLKQIRLREKLMAMVIFGIFYLAFHFKFLDKLWHGGSFPIWYVFRYSFTLCFFSLILALKSYRTFMQSSRHWRISTAIATVLLLVSSVIISYYYYLHVTSPNLYQYVTPETLLISFTFIVVYLVLCQLKLPNKMLPYRDVLLAILVIIELTGNNWFIQQHLSYVNVSKYADYQQIVEQSVSGIRPSNNTFYRTTTTFQRTKDDALAIGYYGLNHFGSTIEAHVSKLYGLLGLPDGSGFATYTNGTLFTDDFFNIRYVIEPSTTANFHTDDTMYPLVSKATKFDLNAYPTLIETERFRIRENSQRLGLGFEVNSHILDSDFKLHDHQSLQNQEKLMALLNLNADALNVTKDEAIFKQVALEGPTLQHVVVSDDTEGDYKTYTKQTDIGVLNQHGTMTYTFSTPSHNPYYFTLPSQWDNKVSLTLNGAHYAFYSPFKKRQITSASYDQIQQQQTLQVTLDVDELKANSPKLFEFNQQRYAQLMDQAEKQSFHVTQFSHHTIEGDITIQQEQGNVLFTIPYDSNWRITANGKNIDTFPLIEDTLLGIQLPKGVYHLTLQYKPYSIIYGLGVSILGIALFIMQQTLRKKLTT